MEEQESREEKKREENSREVDPDTREAQEENNADRANPNGLLRYKGQWLAEKEEQRKRKRGA